MLRKNWVLGPLQWGYFSSCICSVRNWFASLDSFPVGLGLCQGCSYPLSYYFLWTEFLGAVKRWTVSSLVALGSCFCFLQMMCVCVLDSSTDILHLSLGQFAAECEMDRMRISSFKSEATVLGHKRVECPILVWNEKLPQVEVSLNFVHK